MLCKNQKFVGQDGWSIEYGIGYNDGYAGRIQHNILKLNDTYIKAYKIGGDDRLDDDLRKH